MNGRIKVSPNKDSCANLRACVCVRVCARACEGGRSGQRLRLAQNATERGGKRKSKLIHTSQFWQEEKNRSVSEALIVNTRTNRHTERLLPQHTRQETTAGTGDRPAAFRINFVCHLKVDHYLNPR